MSEEKLLNLLSSESKRNQIRGWLRDGKKRFIENFLQKESEEARMEFQQLISSICFKQHFPSDVQRKIAKMERDEQWDQLRNFIWAQGNDMATLEYLKWERRNGIHASSSTVSNTAAEHRDTGIHGDINAISTSDTRNNRSNSPYRTQNTNIQPSEFVTYDINSFVPRPPVQIPQPLPGPTANRFRTTIQTNQNPQQRHASPSNNIRANRNLNNIPIRQRFDKTTDRSWTFYIPSECCKHIIGRKGQHIKRYKEQKYVTVSVQNTMGPSKVEIDGFDSIFEDVYYICIDIWQRLSMFSEDIIKEFLPMPSSVSIDRISPNRFQQLLFMEDYNVFFRKPGPLWEVCAFSREELEKAKTALTSTHPFRQDAPLSPANSVDTLILASSRISLNERNPEMRRNKIITPVFNKRTFEKPPTKVVIKSDESVSNCLKKETNILLLGQTGVGKSTFLNSFANYIEFGQDFEKAEKGLRVMITAKYVLSYDEAGQGTYTDPVEVLIQPDGGDDGNEVLEEGETIQAIVFLLNPSDARATAPLLYNLSELLKRIHKNAAENILFCFPRSDWTTQVDAAQALRPFFKKISDTCKVNLEMKMSGIDGCQNVFRVDNYGFLYCRAKKFAGFKEKGEERQMAMKRWANSVKDIEKMLSTIAKLRDYPIQRTLEINDAGNWLKALAEPMADLSRQIVNSENSLRAKQNEIKQLALEQKTIEGHATYEEHQVVRVPLEHSSICCYGEKCCIAFNESNKIPDVCHDKCECYEGEEESGQNILQCKIFKNGICSKCNCPWDIHRKMKWRLEKNTVVVTSEAGVLAASTNATERQKANILIDKLEHYIEKNKESMERMQKNAAIFATFLQQNSLITENDSFVIYLDQCIGHARNSGDQNQYQKLIKFRENYEQEKQMLKSAEKIGKKVTFEEVHKTLKEMEKDPIISISIKKYIQILGINDDEAVAEEKCQMLKTLFGKSSTR